MCPSEVTCLLADCYFSGIALCNPTKHVGLVQTGHHDYLSNITCSCNDIAEIVIIWRWTTPLTIVYRKLVWYIYKRGRPDFKQIRLEYTVIWDLLTSLPCLKHVMSNTIFNSFFHVIKYGLIMHLAHSYW